MVGKCRHSESVASCGSALLLALLLCLSALSVEAKEAPVEISADHLLVEEKDRRATYSGHVELRQDDLRVNADKIVVHGSAGTVQKVVASGKPVRLQQQQRRGTADELVYDPQSETIVLTGNASLSQGQDAISGQRVLYNLKTQRIEVEGGEQKRVESRFYPKREAAPTQQP